MAKRAPLSASLEDYLEAILLIREDKHTVLARDIASRLGVSRPSVTGALAALGRQGMVEHRPYDAVLLTPAGERAAGDVVRRHRALRDFFSSILRVGEAEAESAACALEHAMPAAIVDRLVAFVARLKKSPRVLARWRRDWEGGA
jgi:DtxR family Mn-dependent transcriptional regulator